MAACALQTGSPAFALELPPRRIVRLDVWKERFFHVVPCDPFRIGPWSSNDLVAALELTERKGYRHAPGMAVLASGQAHAGRRGTIHVQIEPPGKRGPDIQFISREVLSRSLPQIGPARPGALREEVEELLRWSTELGRGLEYFYVSFVPTDTPRTFRPAGLHAVFERGALVEDFEVRTRRSLRSRRNPRG